MKFILVVEVEKNWLRLNKKYLFLNYILVIYLSIYIYIYLDIKRVGSGGKPYDINIRIGLSAHWPSG